MFYYTKQYRYWNEQNSVMCESRLKEIQTGPPTCEMSKEPIILHTHTHTHVWRENSNQTIKKLKRKWLSIFVPTTKADILAIFNTKLLLVNDESLTIERFCKRYMYRKRGTTDTGGLDDSHIHTYYLRKYRHCQEIYAGTLELSSVQEVLQAIR